MQLSRLSVPSFIRMIHVQKSRSRCPLPVSAPGPQTPRRLDLQTLRRCVNKKHIMEIETEFTGWCLFYGLLH